jgi:hypothetical protein
MAASSLQGSLRELGVHLSDETLATIQSELGSCTTDGLRRYLLNCDLRKLAASSSWPSTLNGSAKAEVRGCFRHRTACCVYLWGLCGDAGKWSGVIASHRGAKLVGALVQPRIQWLSSFAGAESHRRRVSISLCGDAAHTGP